MESVERVIRTLDHEEPDKVPQTETFGQAEARDLFFPHDVESSPDWVLKESRWWGRDLISISINAPNLLSEVLVSEPGRTGYSIHREAWGSITYSRRIPGFHKVLRSPVVWPEDLDRIDPPPLSSYESKIADLAETVRTYKEAGFFVEAFHNGPFVMSWHRLRGMKKFLMDLVRDRSFARRLVDFAMGTQLELTKAVIDEVKPHAIRLGNDMGTNESLFFPPRTYMEIFNPWERKLCREYHGRGMFVHHHCHGNINLILEDMVAAGVDAIDPMDPDDGIELAWVKEKYGDKITLRGGISKYVGTYDREGIRSHILDRLNIGSPGGGYIVQSAGGLPHDMPRENFRYFKETMAKLRKYPR